MYSITRLVFLTICAMVLFSATAAADNCSDLIEEMAKAKNRVELTSKVEKLKLREQELKSCESKIKSHAQTKNLINSEKQALTAKSRTHFTATSKKVQVPEKLAINRRALQLRGEAKTRLSTLQRAQLTTGRIDNAKPVKGNASSTNSGTPSITRITPSTLTPGTDVVIEGSNLGTNPGVIKLRLQGKSFTAVINSWNDTFVNAYLEDSIGGVQASDNAVINLTRPQGGSVDKNIPFLPLYVQESASEEYDSPGSLIFPGEGTETVFTGKHLNTGWKVTEFEVSREPDYGRCSLGTPSMSVGNTRVESKLNWSFDWFQGFAWCYVDVYAEGPQGIASGL